MKKLATIIGCLAISTLGFSQIKTPRPSPGATIIQDLGLSSVAVKYSRPGVKDRTIYGDLVPFGQVWRTGANAATSIEFKSDVTIEGKELKAGKYALLSIPNKEEWTIIFSKNATVSAPKYKEEEDALRITVKPTKYNERVETFTINFADVKNNSVTVELLWENTAVRFKVETDVDSKVMSSIDKAINGPSSRDLYVAASYYFDNDKDMDKAEEWINKAVELDSEKPKFWVVHMQAKILAKNGKKKEAIAAAEKSIQLAEEAKYDSYVKKNKDLIDSLK